MRMSDWWSDVFSSDLLLERLDDLEGATDAGMADAVGPEPVDAAAGEADAAFIGAKDAGDHVEAGGLAGTVRADQADDAALGHRKAGPGHGTQATDAFRDAVDAEQIAAAHGFFKSEERGVWKEGGHTVR